jgi:hypothetical protein
MIFPRFDPMTAHGAKLPVLRGTAKPRVLHQNSHLTKDGVPLNRAKIRIAKREAWLKQSAA